jgi:nicotinamidase-related amidase
MAIDKSKRSESALVVIDVQVGVVSNAHERDQKIANMNIALEKARSKNIPIIWVQHSEDEMPIDSDHWQIVPELKPLPSEPIVRKTYRNTFEATNFEDVLDSLNVGHLYICGAQTNNCVRHTSHAALERGYDVTLIGDAHTTSGFEWNGYVVDAARVIDEQTTNFYEDLPGRSADVKKAADLWN